MRRFFVDSDAIEENHIIITGSDVKHIKTVLRLIVGDSIIICDGSGIDYISKIDSFHDYAVACSIREKVKSNTEPYIKIALFQGVPKSDKMDLIIQKTVELGVFEIYPVTTKRTVTKLNNLNIEKKYIRWNRISMEACKQCGRAIIPRIYKPIGVKQVAEIINMYDLFIVLYENEEKKHLKDIIKCYNINSIGKIAVMIGPEGGFSLEEVKMLKDNGALIAGLGNRILRTETAAIATVSNIVYEIQ